MREAGGEDGWSKDVHVNAERRSGEKTSAWRSGHVLAAYGVKSKSLATASTIRRVTGTAAT